MTGIVAKSNVAFLKPPKGKVPGAHAPRTSALPIARACEPPSDLDVAIVSVATAVPKHKISQREATARAKRLFPHLASRDNLFLNTGIEARYACEPPDWYHQRRSWEERTNAFNRHAVDLVEEAAVNAIAAAGLDLGDIDALV